MTAAAERGTGRSFDVEQRQAEFDQLRAQVDGAQVESGQDRRCARPRSYVTNLALRKAPASRTCRCRR